ARTERSCTSTRPATPSISTTPRRTSTCGPSRSTATRRRNSSWCRRPSMPRARSSDRRFQRALAYLVPYWPSLAVVAGLSLVSTATALALPYLSKILVDRALLGRDPRALYQIVGWFAATSVASFVLTAVTGLRYTRISASILFDMRLALYRHLQRLSPRFYARTPLGDVLARVNNDVGEIQRVAAEALLAWA